MGKKHKYKKFSEHKHTKATSSVQEIISQDAVMTPLEKFKNIVNKVKLITPCDQGKFTPDLRQVDVAMYIRGDWRYVNEVNARHPELSEYGAFIQYPNQPQEHSVLSMTADEILESIISYDQGLDKMIYTRSGAKVEDIENVVYVITKDRKLILNKHYHHSASTQDEAVIGAGHMSIHGGKIASINNSSGHYTPELLDLYNSVKSLPERAFADDVRIVICQSSPNPERIYTLEQFRENAEPLIEAARQNRIDQHKKIGHLNTVKLDQDYETLSPDFIQLGSKKSVTRGKNLGVMRDRDFRLVCSAPVFIYGCNQY